MKNTFILFDIADLINSFKNATKMDDCLINFLNRFNFDYIYTTDDNSNVFDAGGENNIIIEFFDFYNTYTRRMMIMYLENGKYYTLEYK